MILGGPKVAALGGGHGLASTLAATRCYAGHVTAVVSVADDGGSSGRLRQMTGIPAPGDLRRCLGALADPSSVWAQAFEHRFGDGELGGHAFGNLVIAVLAEITGDFSQALEHAATLLGVEGRVVPATRVAADLVARVDGQEVVGQVRIAESVQPIEQLWVRPVDAPAPIEAVAAVESADQLVLGPGSLYTSVLAAAVVPDLTAAIRRRRGGRVFVANLGGDEHEGAGFAPLDQLRVLHAHGVVVDVMIYDPAVGGRATGSLGPKVDGVRCIAADVRAPSAHGGPQGSLRHDPQRLAAVLATSAAQALLPGG